MHSERHVATQKQDCHTLQRVDLGALGLACVKIELKTASKWLCPSEKYEALESQLSFVQAASFQRYSKGPLLGVHKANVFAARKNEIAAVTPFVKMVQLGQKCTRMAGIPG